MKVALFTDTFLPQINGVTKTLGKYVEYMEKMFLCTHISILEIGVIFFKNNYKLTLSQINHKIMYIYS